jgi:hypothetical protein
VAADLFHQDERLSHSVFRALEDGLAEVMVWGEHWPERLEQASGEMRHQLSAAAVAFKSHALAAARDPAVSRVAAAETFRCGTLVRPARGGNRSSAAG